MKKLQKYLMIYQFLQMSGVDEKTADRDGRLMACEVSNPDKIDNLWKFINDGGRSSIPKSMRMTGQSGIRTCMESGRRQKKTITASKFLPQHFT